MTEKNDVLTDLADHLCARRPCGDTPENVADWLQYSLGRCHAVVISEQEYAAFRSRPTASADVVERVATVIEREFYSFVDDPPLPGAKPFEQIARAALSATGEGPDVDVLVVAAKATGSALDDFIRLIDRGCLTGTYKWTRPPTHDEAQEAMRANNVLSEVLATIKQGER